MNHLIIFSHDLYKKIVSIGFFLIIKIFLPHAKYTGAKALKNKFKTSDSMFALATGSSIEDYSDSDFSLIKSSNSIGINFFILNKFEPTLYLIETHPNSLGYFNFLEKKLKNPVPIMYKGYSSHKKISLVVKNIKAVSKKIEQFLVIKDGYIRNKWASLPGWKKNNVLDISSSDFLYNDTASILYVVFMSYKMGYKNVILCGFDMSDKYFYCNPNHESYEYAVNHGHCTLDSVNTIHDNEDRKKNIINILIDMDNKFSKERGGGVFVYTSDGILSRHLRLYDKEHSSFVDK